MKDTDNISIKSRSINYNSEKKNEAKKNFRGQIWGQANFWGQAKIWVEAKIEARPTLGPGQANGARPGFIVCLKHQRVQNEQIPE